jgi:hypothetical protein
VTAHQGVGSHRDRILHTLRISPMPLDDDLLAERAGISPRHTVNQICRRLHADGLVDRVPGPDGKIVNVLRAVSKPTTVTPLRVARSQPIDDAEVVDLPVGHSREQRAAEVHLLAGLAQAIGLPSRWMARTRSARSSWSAGRTSAR